MIPIFRLEEMENERNQEMEEICQAAAAVGAGDDSNTPVDESTFSFPSSAVEDLWHDEYEHFDAEIDETDQDRTLTTLTLHTTSSPPDSAMATMARHYGHNNTMSELGHNHNRSNLPQQQHEYQQQSNGSFYRFSQEGSQSGRFSNGSSGQTIFTPFQQNLQQSRFGSNGPIGYGGYVYSNGNASQQHQLQGSNGHPVGGGGGQAIGNGNGGFIQTTYYIGFTRTTAV